MDIAGKQDKIYFFLQPFACILYFDTVYYTSNKIHNNTKKGAEYAEYAGPIQN